QGAIAVAISCGASLGKKQGLDGWSAHAFSRNLCPPQPDRHSDVRPWLRRYRDARLHVPGLFLFDVRACQCGLALAIVGKTPCEPALSPLAPRNRTGGD